MSETENYLSVEVKEERQDNTALLLLELVHNYEFLYDVKHRDYKNNKKKDYVWREIAGTLRTTVDNCQKVWKSLRDRYTREKREMGRLGLAASESKWDLFPRMAFYENYTKPRRKYTSSQVAAVNSGTNAWGPVQSPEKPELQAQEMEVLIEEDVETTVFQPEAIVGSSGRPKTQSTTLEIPTCSKRKRKATEANESQILDMAKSMASSLEIIQERQIKQTDTNRSFVEYVYCVLNDMPSNKAKSIRKRIIKILLEEDQN